MKYRSICGIILTIIAVNCAILLNAAYTFITGDRVLYYDELQLILTAISVFVIVLLLILLFSLRKRFKPSKKQGKRFSIQQTQMRQNQPVNNGQMNDAPQITQDQPVNNGQMNDASQTRQNQPANYGQMNGAVQNIRCANCGWIFPVGAGGLAICPSCGKPVL